MSSWYENVHFCPTLVHGLPPAPHAHHSTYMDVGTLTTNAHNLGLTYNDTRTRPVADLGPPWVTAVVLVRPPRELKLACRLELLLAGLRPSRMDAAAPLDDHEVRSARKLRPSWPAVRQ